MVCAAAVPLVPKSPIYMRGSAAVAALSSPSRPAHISAFGVRPDSTNARRRLSYKMILNIKGIINFSSVCACACEARTLARPLARSFYPGRCRQFAVIASSADVLTKRVARVKRSCVRSGTQRNSIRMFCRWRERKRTQKL